MAANRISRLGRPRKSHGYRIGHKHDKTYSAWVSMLHRCICPTSKQWHNYGGRGITVCARWQSFENFLEDMGKAPEGLTLDRFPNNNGNYEKSNCRWATQKQQAQTRRTTLRITFNGKTLNMTEWAAEVGLKKNALQARLSNGWSVKRALTTPTRRYG